MVIDKYESQSVKTIYFVTKKVSLYFVDRLHTHLNESIKIRIMIRVDNSNKQIELKIEKSQSIKTCFLKSAQCPRNPKYLTILVTIQLPKLYTTIQRYKGHSP